MKKEIEIGSQEFWDAEEAFKLKRKSKGRFSTDEALRELYKNIEIKTPIKGNVVNGEYLGLIKNAHTFKVRGFKDYVYVDNRFTENKYLDKVEIGNNTDILIIDTGNKTNIIKGSISDIHNKKAINTFRDIAQDTIVDILVKSINPAGYEVEIYHEDAVLSGFMPNTLAGINKLYNPESIVGLTMKAMLENYAQNDGTYVVSRRKYLNTLIPSEIEKLTNDKVYTGHVTGTTPFGVFIEFPATEGSLDVCLTGMIYKTNIHPEWQNKIQEIQAGTEIDFYVKEIFNNKIILTQILRDSLWDTIKEGDSIKGRVKANNDNGSLISLDYETMGLIPNIELEVKSDVEVIIQSIDRKNRKIILKKK